MVQNEGEIICDRWNRAWMLHQLELTAHRIGDYYQILSFTYILLSTIRSKWKRFSSYFYLIFVRIKITNRSVIFHFKLSLSLFSVWAFLVSPSWFGHFDSRSYLDPFYIVQMRSLSVFCNLWPNRGGVYHQFANELLFQFPIKRLYKCISFSE
jgi:hypothetical protein